jgi:hypothetical protein
MSRASPAELPKLLDVFKADRWLFEDISVSIDSFYPGEMQYRVQKNGRMAIRQHEPVAIGPSWIAGIET